MRRLRARSGLASSSVGVTENTRFFWKADEISHAASASRARPAATSARRLV
jgi:hypothetical protein